jgi:DNA-3-methyladenine glycosylase II
MTDARLAPSAHRALTPRSLQRGAKALAARDADLARVLERCGVPPLWGRPPGFSTLVRIILEQQVSLGSARAMYTRLSVATGRVTAASVARLGQDGLRGLGFTRQKAAYCHGLAERVIDGRIDLRAVGRASHAEAQRMLMTIPGLGKWSADIYDVMALRRPDVWPRGDLALAAAMRDVKRMSALPSAEEQDRIAAAWRPWRAVAARILWTHYLDRRRASQSPAAM